MSYSDPTRQKSFQADWYAKRRETYAANNKQKRELYRAVVAAARNGPCTDCKHTYPPYVMEFDHVPERGPKLFAIGQGFQVNYNLQRLETELAKCDRVCANCHLIRAHQRK